jgi:hypothetical protein
MIKIFMSWLYLWIFIYIVLLLPLPQPQPPPPPPPPWQDNPILSHILLSFSSPDFWDSSVSRLQFVPDTLFYDMIDIFVNCNWVATRWQQYNTHLHTNSTQNNTKQTIHRTTQKFWKSVGGAPSLQVLLWHLPYNWGKSTEKPQSG